MTGKKYYSLVPGQKVKLKSIEWFNKNATGNKIAFGFNDYSTLEFEKFVFHLGKEFYISKVHVYENNINKVEAYLLDDKGKPNFRDNSFQFPENCLTVLKEFKITVEQKNAVKTFLSKFDRAFVEQIGTGGGSGQIMKYDKTNVMPCFTDEGKQALFIPGLYNPYKCLLTKLQSFMKDKFYSKSWAATQHTDITEKISLLEPGEVYDKSNYNWEMR